MDFPKKIDFHMHTTTSDGTDTPELLLEKIRQNGIDMFAVTDHDAISACESIRHLLRETGEDKNIRFVNGVEFSCEDAYGKYHILGYGYDIFHPEIRKLVTDSHGLRMTKLSRRIEFLEDEFGFTFPQEEVNALFSLRNPGKLHIANMIVRQGYAENKDIAIKKYLNHVTYQGRVHIFPEDAIEVIVKAGGIPMLAHPCLGDGSQKLDDREMRRRLTALKACGLLGLEAYYSVFSKETTDRMLSFADEFDLLVSAGSDYHGTNKQVALGQTGLKCAAEGGPRLKAFIEAFGE